MVPSLISKNLEIDHSTWISCNDLQYLPGRHVGKGLFGAQDGQWADKAAHIQLYIPIPIHELLQHARLFMMNTMSVSSYSYCDIGNRKPG